MFDFLTELLLGQHQTLPRRRHPDPVADAQPRGATGSRIFYAPAEDAIGDGTWLGLRVKPTATGAAPDPVEGLSVIDEVRQLVNAPPTPTAPPAATSPLRPIPASDRS